MPLTIEDGLKAAKLKAHLSADAYTQANQRYGRLIESYRGDVARNVGVGHLLRVNPDLINTPAITKDRRRGFLRATIGMANAAQIAWEKLDDITTCAYIWGRDINDDSRTLYGANKTLFATPSEDFWRCAYLKHVLGNAAFRVVWNTRNREQATVYDGLLYAVNELSRGLPGWPIITLKKTVFLECAFVFEIAKRGGSISTTGYGIQPVLPRTAMQQVYQ